MLVFLYFIEVMQTVKSIKVSLVPFQKPSFPFLNAIVTFPCELFGHPPKFLWFASGSIHCVIRDRISGSDDIWSTKEDGGTNVAQTRALRRVHLSSRL